MITTRSKNNFSVSVSNGKHTIAADVDEKLGGDDTALNPHELLEGSLGACTTITVLMYARRKNWPLKDVATSVKIVSEQGEKNEILREIHLTGDLSAEQRDRLLQIANSCPMHKFLQKSSSIETRLHN